MQVFPTSELQVEGVNVVWILEDGKEAIGRAKFTPTGKLTAVIFLPEGGRVDLPEAAAPPRWRPQNPDTWPFDLPEQKLDLVSNDIDQPDGSEWPYPGLRLGSANEVPASLKECEARILRGLRTEWQQSWEPTEPGGWAWPPSCRTEIRKIERALSSSRTGKNGRLKEDDYQDYYAGSDQREGRRNTDSRPLPPKWRPTPRDISDYEARLRPTRFIPKSLGKSHRVFQWRAASPPYSWMQISELLRVPPEAAMEDYKCAIKRAYNLWQQAAK